MKRSRRTFLVSIAGSAAVLATQVMSGAGVPTQRATPQPLPSPNAPNPQFPPGLNGPDITPHEKVKTIDPQSQKNLRADVEQLYELATELKSEFDRTDSSAMLSVAVIKQAQKIEKLAKKIRELSKG